MLLMVRRLTVRLILAIGIAGALYAAAGYKIRHWSPLPIESYPCRQTNDGVTIAADPLYTDALAAKVFDRKDMLGRGILPLALIVKNDNDFAIEISAESIELVLADRHLRTLDPLQVLQKLYGRPYIMNAPGTTEREASLQVPLPLPRVPEEAILDFKQKYFGHKYVFSHSIESGFLYVPVARTPNLTASLTDSMVYIPDVIRVGARNQILFFEFDLKPAMAAARKK